MAYLSVPKEAKQAALNTAKAEFERDLYKAIARLGLDPDTFDLDSFEFNEEAMTKEEIENPDFVIKKQISIIISRIGIINNKIAAL